MRYTLITTGTKNRGTPIEPLVKTLNNWHSGPEVSSALTKLVWKPETTEQEMLFLIGQRDKTLLLKKWDTFKKFLLE